MKDVKKMSREQKIAWLEIVCDAVEEAYTKAGLAGMHYNEIHLSTEEFYNLFRDTEYEYVNRNDEKYPVKAVRRQDGYVFFCLLGPEDTVKSVSE